MNFADMWNKAAAAPPKQFSSEPLPEGKYMMEVVSCGFGKTKDQLKEMVIWDLRVISGEYKNSHLWVNRPFSKTDDSEQNQKAIQRALNDFIDLGLDASQAKIGETLCYVVGKTVEIYLKNDSSGGQFKNFRRIVEGAVDAPKPAATTAPGAGAFPGVPDDDVPF